ncbi:IS1595 family transposase [Paenibacillus sp. YYML68]|uniref:IS1595 family transposase n=1 Tax=Paenibacillus sp. YYML68 TaxID=2909250 RepID=UPI0024904A38|nr:IS1595 family transposase [Paenibacillus sp. YYML68]
MQASGKGKDDINFIYKSDAQCQEELFRNKWPNGFQCSQCGHRSAYTIRSRKLPLYECSQCSHQHSLLTGTIMEKSRTPLYKWFAAMHLVSQHGISATRLSVMIQVTYKTAWLMLQKIRHAISDANQHSKLSGAVYIQSAYYGNPFVSKLQAHPSRHPLLVGASMHDPSTPMQVTIQQIGYEYLRYNQLIPTGMQWFKDHFTLPTRCNYECVTALFSTTKKVALLQIAAQASSWLNNTFRGIGSKHLQVYLDEFCFTLNYSLQGIDSYPALLQLCSQSTHRTYMSIVNKACLKLAA